MYRNLAMLNGAVIITSYLVHGAGSAYADLIVAPNNLATVEGNGGNAFPFGGGAQFPTQRYQQIYAASQFATVAGPHFITQISFREDAVFGQVFAGVISNIQINLSASNAAPDGLSTTFANNIGSNDTIVHSGQLLLTSAFVGPAGGPKAFDIVIDLQTPFLYDPGAGNLLLDVRRFSDGIDLGGTFDYENTTGDSISRVYTNNTIPGGVTSPTGVASSGGLVTEFTLTAAVPEPTTFCLVGLGIIGMVGHGLRSRWCAAKRRP